MKNMQLDGLAIAIPENFPQVDLIDPRKEWTSGIHYCHDCGTREYEKIAKIFKIFDVCPISL